MVVSFSDNVIYSVAGSLKNFRVYLFETLSLIVLKISDRLGKFVLGERFLEVGITRKIFGGGAISTWYVRTHFSWTVLIRSIGCSGCGQRSAVGLRSFSS